MVSQGSNTSLFGLLQPLVPSGMEMSLQLSFLPSLTVTSQALESAQINAALDSKRRVVFPQKKDLDASKPGVEM